MERKIANRIPIAPQKQKSHFEVGRLQQIMIEIDGKVVINFGEKVLKLAVLQ